jgi:tRNA(Ile)-lysidine synthase
MILSDRVLRTIRRYGLVPSGGRVLVALSGGPDSVALVHLLWEIERSGALVVAGLAHFNHCLRGDEADEDERFCRRLAESCSLPIEVGREDVRALAARERRSIEDAARSARYAFLEDAASRLGADVIATGHSRDDQAETFLLRLMRGAGPRGLAGIFPRAGRVVRPLLEIRRADLRKYAEERQLAFREDATNRDVSIPRNRIRHELIPYLERELSPGIVEVLAREADIARDDEDRLNAEAIALLDTVVLGDVPSGHARDAELDAARLGSLHPALAARVAREVLARVAAGRSVQAHHVERLLALTRGEGGDAASLPGVEAVRRNGVITLGPPRPRAFSNSFRFPLSIPGEVVLSDPGWAVSAAWGSLATPQTQTADAEVAALGGTRPAEGWLQAWVEAGAVRLPLTVRSRKPGDRLRPSGLGGRRKKLQDLLVDRKIERTARDLLPLVVDADDRIVWVVGEPTAEDFRVTGPSQGVILLKARRLGGPG